MKRLVRRLLVVVSGALLALPIIGVSPVAASCSQAYYIVWESPGSAPGDGLKVCLAVAFPDLRSVGHTQAGICAAGFVKTDDNWNDCISKAQVFKGSESHHVCFYTNTFYGGSRYVLYPGSAVSWFFGDTFSDTISSIRWDC